MGIRRRVKFRVCRGRWAGVVRVRVFGGVSVFIVVFFSFEWLGGSGWFVVIFVFVV